MTRSVTAAPAFFDVDETLIAVKSMFSFLRYYLAAVGEPPSVYARATDRLRQQAARGVARESVNRSFYRLFADQPVAPVSAAGREWFAELLTTPHLLIDEPARRLRDHRDRGDPVVLVSGSFFACLDPIAEFFGATVAVGTETLVRRGRLTGEVTRPMIGRAKRDAARAFLLAGDLDPARSAAYADHESDLPLLGFVGHPHIVGNDPALLAHGAPRSWPVLPATTSAQPAVLPTPQHLGERRS